MKKIDISKIDTTSPSQFMRELRPEYYSDTEDRVMYSLGREVLEYHLHSITQRNETHNFEVFCRKLCERTICPNLRSHTGPDGGGDSKVDTETYPVADEISTLFLVGHPDAGRERWAFAISAKEKWKPKILADVAKIIETKRDYKKIFFITSMFVRDKDRANMEDTLSKQYRTPIIIHDRSWIIKEIIENNRRDIAYNYLGIGEEKSDPFRLGPEDYSRARQLADIEKDFDDPNAFEGMKMQRVTEALIAAKLSRNLERPRSETDGRFIRAIRLADADGTNRQKLEAKYEQIWTAFWWFDDFQFLKDNYEFFENIAIISEHAIDLELLCNLHQLLVNSILYKYMTPDECKFNDRQKRLVKALEKLVSDSERPNNSLEAENSLLIIRMNQAWMRKDRKKLTEIWNDFSTIVEKADGLGEFKAGRLKKMIEVTGKIAGNDPAYNNLVEKIAEFIAKRESDVSGAKILLERAKQLDLENNFQILRLLGKAAIQLNKAEYRDYLIDALWLLMLAYRSAGLLWAARATCITLAATIVIKGEEDNEIPASIIPVMKIWAWIALELQHIPDFFHAIQLMNGALATLPLTEESKAKVNEDIFNLDLALGCLFLNLDKKYLSKLVCTPDILDGLGLIRARSALLYKMGHIATLRDEGYFPATESDKEINQLYCAWFNQPVAQQLRGSAIFNNNSQSLSTCIMGMTIEIDLEGSDSSILVAELLLGFIETFFATAIEKNTIIPHTEKIHIKLIEDNKISKPLFEIDLMNFTSSLLWPTSLSPVNHINKDKIHSALSIVTIEILVKSCIFQDSEALMHKLFLDDGANYRIALSNTACISYHRVFSRYVSRLSDWEEHVKKSFDLQPNLPALIKSENHNDLLGAEEVDISKPPEIKDHRKISVSSIIDIHAWDKAKWRGVAYGMHHSSYPPFLALSFENEEAGKSIFGRWIQRLGKEDKNDEIHLSIIRQLPNQNAHHYFLLISSNSKKLESHEAKIITLASRYQLMEPTSSVNLENFLNLYKKFGAFYLLPAILNATGNPNLLSNLAILKRNITIKLSREVGANDIESVVLREYQTK